MRRTKLMLCYITAANMEEATKISEILIQEQLVACTNIIKNVNSLYMWENKLNHSDEVVIVAKSREILFTRISETVKRHHSYDTPCIVALPIINGSDEFLHWIEEETKEASIFEEVKF